MRIDASQILAQGGAKLNAGTEKGLAPLPAGSEGDVLEASSRQTGRTREAPDKSLEPYLGKLAELNMPVSEGAARMMRAIMAQNPGVTPDEAAFLASNKLAGDENLMKAALDLLSSGEKTDVMIARLLALLGQEKPDGADVPWSSQPARADELQAAGSGPPQGPPAAQPGPHIPQPAAALSLADLLAAILRGAEGAGGAGGNGNSTPPQSSQTIIAQSDVILQSTNVVNMQEFIKNDDNLLNQEALMSKIQQLQTSNNPGSGVQNPDPGIEGRPAPADATAVAPEPMPATAPATAPATLPGAAEATLPGAAGAMAGGAAPGDVMTGDVMTGGAMPGGGPTAPAGAQSAAQEPPGSAVNSGANPPAGGFEAPVPALSKPAVPGSNLHAQLSALLAEIPEFRGTPPQALERFSSMLLRIAGQGAPTPGGGAEKLQAQLDRLFTRIGKGDTDAGARLKEAREELYARLALIEEAVSGAAPAGKAEMHGQTHRLMEHVRLLNNIDQFAYMQLPVQFGEERKTAELYLFRKKGNRKPDPENVNILLALDLEHMGHWESLINIRKKDVSIQMEVRGEREKEHFSENTVMLHEMLAEAGFKLVNTDIKHSEKETTPLTALLSLGRYTAGRSGTVDFWV